MMNEQKPGAVASTDQLGLVERLRLIAAWNTPGGPEPSVKPDKMATCNEAADRVIDLTLEVQSLRAEVEALRADAERYRWLRKASVEGWHLLGHYTQDALDAAIDAARTK